MKSLYALTLALSLTVPTAGSAYPVTYHCHQRPVYHSTYAYSCPYSHTTSYSYPYSSCYCPYCSDYDAACPECNRALGNALAITAIIAVFACVFQALVSSQNH